MKPGRTQKQWLADVTAVLCLALGVFLGSFFVPAARIWTNGATATGVVDEKIFTAAKGEDVDRYVLRYSFAVASGEGYRGQDMVTGTLYKKVAVGGPVVIEYAADDPTDNRVRGDFDPLAIEFAGLIVVGLGLFWYIGPRRWLRTWRGEPDPILT